MANYNIEKLASLLDRPDASKEEIMANIEQIQFSPIIPIVSTDEASDFNEVPKKRKALHTLKLSPPHSINHNSTKNLGRNQQKELEDFLLSSQQSSSTKTIEETLATLRMSYKKPDPTLDHNLKKYSISLSKNALANSPPSTIKTAHNVRKKSNFLERMEKYQHQRQLRLESQKVLSKETELDRCSFSPRTNGKSRRSSFLEDLQRYEIWKKENMEQHFIEKEQREKATYRECTFKPKINSKKVECETSEITRLRKMRSLENEEFTFHPKVAKAPKSRKKLQEYLSTSPYERLSKQLILSLIHICRCRRYAVCRSRWSPYH
eukprot:TRINITY_DN7661_c0_g1_i4.p1 TRINITY_DN7661_c0_g1~~TRINITY_DN7661_c0_g1_i4.p1  ORF type:complete len:321 (+),score=47.11 TRINITY_DN7661_c0_g1_i4:35-997(+)